MPFYKRNGQTKGTGCDMKKRLLHCCLALVLLAPSVSLPARSVKASTPAKSSSDKKPTAKPAVNHAVASRFDLAQHSVAETVVAQNTVRAPKDPISSRSMAALDARYGVGQIGNIEGPSVSYQRSSRSPVFEAGALGGGMESAPFLAHVAMNWQF
jgi:hypothetical protein